MRQYRMDNDFISLHLYLFYAHVYSWHTFFSVSMGIIGIDVDKDHIFQFKFKTPVNGEAPLIDTGEINFPRVNDPSIYDLPLDMRGIMLNFDFKMLSSEMRDVYL